MEGFGWFTYEVTKRLVENHPEHTFYFFFDRPYDQKFVFAENVIPVVLKPQARRPILFKIWFDYSITRALKKFKIDLFFSPDGYLSMRTMIPQVGVIHDLNFEHHSEDLPDWALKYLKKNTPKFAHKAHALVTVSAYSKQDIEETYGIDSSKITVAHNGASEMFKPVEAAVRTTIKDEYTKGKEYFLFVGALHARKNLKRLLKAFDEFKSRTGSETQLLIVGEKLWKNVAFENELNALNNKDDIHFTGHLDLEVLAKITASAKALAFVSYFEGFGIPLVEAMQCGTPILSGNRTALPEVAGEAAVYCDPFNVDEISKGLEKLDSNAALRVELSKKGLEQAKNFSWNKSAEIIWEVISRTIEKK